MPVSEGTDPHPMLVVPQVACCDWRVMADLFADESGLAHIIIPRSDEQLAQEGIEWLLHALGFGTTSILLSLQTRQKPS